MSAIPIAINSDDEAQAAYDDVLAYFDGDRDAAIRSLLSDVRNLRHRLAISEYLTSDGFTYGWKPSNMDAA